MKKSFLKPYHLRSCLWRRHYNFLTEGTFTAKRVVAFIGSPHRGRTFEIVALFEKKLKELGDIDFKSVSLKDVDLQYCRGCGVCLEKGEEYCALKDDRDALLALMREADGVVFATPVYSLQVTALLKNLLDRLAYVFHRPCFFHKAFIPIAVQGVYGVKGVLSYLDEVAHFWGFKTCPGLGLTVPWDKPQPGEQQKIDEKVSKAAKSFYTLLNDPADPAPGFKDILIFRSVRSAHAQKAGFERDHDYYKEQGWLTSDYYYPAKLGLLKRLTGAWADKQAVKQSVRNKKDPRQ